MLTLGFATVRAKLAFISDNDVDFKCQYIKLKHTVGGEKCSARVPVLSSGEDIEFMLKLQVKFDDAAEDAHL